MKLMTCVALALIALPAHAQEDKHAHEEDTVIEDSLELREWCKTESEGYYVAKGITPYNWTDSWWEKGNTIFVKGSWLIGNEYVVVDCRIAKGARRKYATYEISHK